MIAIVQNLVDDLKGNNIELFIAALDSVGRFLYVSASTATKYIASDKDSFSFLANWTIL